MRSQINPQPRKAFKIDILTIDRRRFDDNLKLIIVLQAIGILAVPPVTRTAAGLHIGGAPRLRPQCPERGRRVKGARAHLDIIRLQKGTALFGPESLERQDHLLEAEGRRHTFWSFSTRELH